MRDIKPGDRYVLHSENGGDYQIKVCNVNHFRESDMIYALDMTDPNGVDYYESEGDWFFCGDDFMQKCEFISSAEE